MTETTDHPWLAHYPPSVDWAAELPVRPVYEVLEDTVKKYGDRPAFDFLGKKWNWAQIGDLVGRMAKGLQQNGVKKDTKVALFLPNTPYALVAYYAVLRAGGTIVHLNPLYAERELAHLIEDSHTEIMVTVDLAITLDKAEKMLHRTRLNKIVVCPFTAALPFPKNILFRLFKGKDLACVPCLAGQVIPFKALMKNDGRPAPVDIDPQNDVAVLQYTGGTTGTPKGAMLTHANIVANVEQAALWFPARREGEEKMLGVLPFFHVFAMTAIMNMSVRCGLEIIALPRFDLEETLKTIHQKKPHFFPAVPAIYSAINAHKGAHDLTSLRYCVSGGAPLPVGVKKTFEGKTGCVVVEGYGLSESSPVVCVNPVDGENKAGAIGLPVSGTIVELRDLKTGEKITKADTPGELCVIGPQVMKGYWNKPEETAAILKDGRLHTGDMAVIDEEGYVYIVDRIKDMVITNGYNVYPRNVEEAIYLHPAVEECIVAGMPDPRRGEAVKVWIKPKDGSTLTIADMKDFLKDKLSPMEIPRLYEFRDEPLPKTMIGKLSRKDIVAEEKC